jgi:hypothetical protein
LYVVVIIRGISLVDASRMHVVAMYLQQLNLIFKLVNKIIPSSLHSQVPLTLAMAIIMAIPAPTLHRRAEALDLHLEETTEELIPQYLISGTLMGALIRRRRVHIMPVRIHPRRAQRVGPMQVLIHRRRV